MDYEARFSIVRWTATIMPVWLALINYFSLKAYLLEVYEPSAAYVDAGWTAWYFTLLFGSLLAVSINLLIIKFEYRVGTQRALKTVAPLMAFVPLYLLVFYRRQDTMAFAKVGSSALLYHPLFVTLLLTLVFHISFFFNKKRNEPSDL